MKRYMVLAVAVLVVGVAVAAIAGPGPGWKGDGNCGKRDGSARRYDPAKEETVTGQVVSMAPIASRRGNSQGLGLTLKTGATNIVVYLGPQWYLDQQTLKLVAGDTVEIKGSKTVRRGEDVFIAAEGKKGSEVLKLRNEKGVPAWAGWRRGENRPGV